MPNIRVITWNLHGSAGPRLDTISDLLKAHDPDVVMLQEVRQRQARTLSVLLGWPKPVWALKHNAYWPLWWFAEGLAVLSRHGLAPHPPILLTPGVSRRSFRRRILLPVEVALEGSERLLLLDAHLTSDAPDEATRVGQAEQAIAVMPGTLPEVIAGDFNAQPGSPSVETIVAAGFGDAWAQVGTPGESGDTFPANAPRERIDYVMVRGARTVAADVIHDLGPAMAGLSDHRPVLAVIDVPHDVSADPGPLQNGGLVSESDEQPPKR